MYKSSYAEALINGDLESGGFSNSSFTVGQAQSAILDAGALFGYQIEVHETEKKIAKVTWRTVNPTP